MAYTVVILIRVLRSLKKMAAWSQKVIRKFNPLVYRSSLN